MTDLEWKTFFTICAQNLGESAITPLRSDNWCSWTTFDRLESDAGYWTAGLPEMEKAGDTYIGDGGTWGQPFLYSSIAHLLIPKRFYWDNSGCSNQEFKSGAKVQAIEAISARLTESQVPHRLTDIVLEVKCY